MLKLKVRVSDNTKVFFCYKFVIIKLWSLPMSTTRKLCVLAMLASYGNTFSARCSQSGCDAVQQVPGLSSGPSLLTPGQCSRCSCDVSHLSLHGIAIAVSLSFSRSNLILACFGNWKCSLLMLFMDEAWNASSAVENALSLVHTLGQHQGLFWTESLAMYGIALESSAWIL